VPAGHDIDSQAGYGRTALMRAAHAGRSDAVKWLIANGANLDHTSKFGLSALRNRRARIPRHDCGRPGSSPR
jgi:ankyrin repeat protein